MQAAEKFADRNPPPEIAIPIKNPSSRALALPKCRWPVAVALSSVARV